MIFVAFAGMYCLFKFRAALCVASLLSTARAYCFRGSRVSREPLRAFAGSAASNVAAVAAKRFFQTMTSRDAAITRQRKLAPLGTYKGS